MSIPTSTDSYLASVLADLLLREESGGAVNRADLIGQHPELTSQLKAFFEVHDRLKALPSPAGQAVLTAAGGTSDTHPSHGCLTSVSRLPTKSTTDPFFLGRYEVLEELGRGGMGVVYRARHRDLDRIVALKILLHDKLDNQESVQRFQTEPKVAARVDHPGIVPIYDVGRVEGVPYYSMAYIQGPSLADRLEEGPFKPREAAQLLVQLAEAVDYAHRQQVLHRDLKPSNVLIDPSGTPRITDFGLAQCKSLGELTNTGQVLGTPAYMSPEQAVAAPGGVGPGADIYSLGATLYAMLTGRPPFQSASVLDTLVQVCEREPISPCALNPQVPNDLQTICLRCLKKSPLRRYRSARELADDLQHFLRGEPIQARPTGVAERSMRWMRRNPAVAGLSGSVLIILLTSVVCLSALAYWLDAARSEATKNANAARRAERARTTQLWNAYLSEARASRFSGHHGRRLTALEAVRKAAEIRPSLALRNEAIAAFTQTDLTPTTHWDVLGENQLRETAAVVLDGNGRRSASSDLEGNVAVRDIRTNQTLLTVAGSGSQAWILRLSAHGRYLAINYEGPRGPFCVWDVDRQTKIVHQDERISHQAIDFDAQERWVVVGVEEKFIRKYRLPGGICVTEFEIPEMARSLAADPTGSVLALVSISNSIDLYDLNTGCRLQSFSLPTNIHGVAWHPYRKLLAVAVGDRGVHLIETRTRKHTTVPITHLSEVTTVAFSQGDGRLLASYGWDNTIRLWDHETGTQLVSLPHVVLPGSTNLQFSADNQRLGLKMAADGQRAQLIEVEAADLCSPLYTDPTWPDRVRSLAFSRNSKLLIAGGSGITFWSIDDRRRLAQSHDTNLGWISWDQDSETIFASSTFDASRSLFRWHLHREADSQGVRWNLSRRDFVYEGQRTWEHGLATSTSVLAVGENDQVSVFARPELQDLGSNSVAQRLRPEVNDRFRQFFKVDVSPDGNWVAAFAYGQMEAFLWNRETGKVALRLTTHAATEGCVRFSPDSQMLIVGDAWQFLFVDLASLQVVAEVKREGGVPDLVFSPDGRLLAATHSPSSVKLLSASSLEELARLELPSPGLQSCLVFSPDGRRLAVGTENRMIWVWDLWDLRHRLASLGLDWEMERPPGNPETSERTHPRLMVEIEADVPTDPHRLATLQLDRMAQRLLMTGESEHASKLADVLAGRRGDQAQFESLLARAAIALTCEEWDSCSGDIRLLLDRYQHSMQPTAFDCVLRLALVASLKTNNQARLCDSAEAAWENEPNKQTRLTLALAKFREGDWESAREHCAVILAKNRRWAATSQASLILSLVEVKSGNLDEARRRFETAESTLHAVEQGFAGPYGLWRGAQQRVELNWVFCHCLLREAQRSLVSRSPFETID